MEKVTAKDLIEVADKISKEPPKRLDCCLCGDVPVRVSLKGELFCNQCFRDVYL